MLLGEFSRLLAPDFHLLPTRCLPVRRGTTPNQSSYDSFYIMSGEPIVAVRKGAHKGKGNLVGALDHVFGN